MQSEDRAVKRVTSPSQKQLITRKNAQWDWFHCMPLPQALPWTRHLLYIRHPHQQGGSVQNPWRHKATKDVQTPTFGFSQGDIEWFA